MQHSILAALLILSSVIAANAARAEVTARQVSKACSTLDNATPKRCTCMGDMFVENFKPTERLYAFAMLRIDEKLLAPVKGKFNDAKSQKVQQKMIPMMLYCMKK